MRETRPRLVGAPHQSIRSGGEQWRVKICRFVDWLKTIGLALIVYGHVAMRTSPLLVPPVYQKQLGVAFFVFAMGFTLARERRPHWRVVYNRAFEVWMMGLLFALLMSAIGLTFWGDANESNFLPLSAITTFYMNDFPGNPTTWYIGTYIHLLLVWALVLRRARITPAGLLTLAAFEIAVRAVLIAVMGRVSANMFLGNWITLLALGMWMGQEGRSTALMSRWSAISVLLTLAVGWPLCGATNPVAPGVPLHGRGIRDVVESVRHLGVRVGGVSRIHGRDHTLSRKRCPQVASHGSSHAIPSSCSLRTCPFTI